MIFVTASSEQLPLCFSNCGASGSSGRASCAPMTKREDPGGWNEQKSLDLRVVVQSIHGDTDSPWHLVAYGGGRPLRPRCFRSVEELLVVIRSALSISTGISSRSRVTRIKVISCIPATSC